MAEFKKNLDLRTCKRCGLNDLAGLFRYSSTHGGFVCRDSKKCSEERQKKLFGTPVICPSCGHEDKIRLFKGTKLKDCMCSKCNHRGLSRNTEYDKERRGAK